MQAHVAENFPKEVKVPRLGIIRAHSPTVRTDGVSERIEIGLNVDLDHPKKELKRLHVAISTKIDYDAATTTFVAVEPRILRIETSDGAKLSVLADRALNAWVVRQWPRLPVYHLEGRDALKPKLTKALLKSVKVQDNGVACRLGW